MEFNLRANNTAHQFRSEIQPGRFKYYLPRPYHLTGGWSVAVKEIIIPFKYFNIEKSEDLSLTYNGETVIGKVEKGCYDSPQDLIKVVNKKIIHLLEALDIKEKIISSPYFCYDSLCDRVEYHRGICDIQKEIDINLGVRTRAILGFTEEINSRDLIDHVIIADHNTNLSPAFKYLFVKANIVDNHL